jgi:hypothetical protein
MSLGEISKSDVKNIYLHKLVENRRLVLRVFIFALIIASSYFIFIAQQQQRTISIVVKPCGNNSIGVWQHI